MMTPDVNQSRCILTLKPMGGTCECPPPTLGQVVRVSVPSQRHSGSEISIGRGEEGDSQDNLCTTSSALCLAQPLEDQRQRAPQAAAVESTQALPASAPPVHVILAAVQPSSYRTLRVVEVIGDVQLNVPQTRELQAHILSPGRADRRTRRPVSPVDAQRDAEAPSVELSVHFHGYGRSWYQWIYKPEMFRLPQNVAMVSSLVSDCSPD